MFILDLPRIFDKPKAVNLPPVPLWGSRRAPVDAIFAPEDIHQIAQKADLQAEIKVEKGERAWPDSNGRPADSKPLRLPSNEMIMKQLSLIDSAFAPHLCHFTDRLKGRFVG